MLVSWSSAALSISGSAAWRASPMARSVASLAGSVREQGAGSLEQVDQELVRRQEGHQTRPARDDFGGLAQIPGRREPVPGPDRRHSRFLVLPDRVVTHMPALGRRRGPSQG
jgi:hypothetical protein